MTNNDLFYDYYEDVFNQSSILQLKDEGVNNMAPFKPLNVDNNNIVNYKQNNYQQWHNQKKYGNINVQSYDSNNQVYEQLYPFNRLPDIKFKVNEPLPSECDVYKQNNKNNINNQYHPKTNFDTFDL